MASFDTPWLTSMSSSSAPAPESAPQNSNQDPNPPTVAQFSPTGLSNSSNLASRRSTILVHQKSPLLIATPPQVTRALAYSHPFLLPLNRVAGLLSWTSGDPWESFLVVAAFWGVVLYGDVVMRWAGPVVFVTILIAGMYLRRYSPLSSTGWSGEKGAGKSGHKREISESNMRHQKSLDEILETLKVFTSRCNVLLEPLLQCTDFLSTQRTATSATTRPALTSLFLRIILITPFWIGLTAPPLRIITTRRVALGAGTLLLTWHSRPARISRTILWRSSTVRRICSSITGLSFGPVPPKPNESKITETSSSQINRANTAAESLGAKRRAGSTGVRFTFSLYENQRRWLGIGWTNSMFAYERGPWTDEHLNPAPSKEEFALPEVNDEHSRWRWVPGAEWRVEGALEGEEGGPKPPPGEAKATTGNSGGGWIYYDNKWRDGRRGQDSWGRYTRRRKWYRDAELVEVTASTEVTPSQTPNPAANPDVASLSETDSRDPQVPPESAESKDFMTDDDGTSSMKKRKWFRGRSRRESRNSSLQSGSLTGSDDREKEERSEGPRVLSEERQDEWGLGDDARMGLG